MSERPTIEQSWLTADECKAAHGVDPMLLPTGKVRNKLRWLRGGHLIRVWLEDDVKKMGERGS